MLLAGLMLLGTAFPSAPEGGSTASPALDPALPSTEDPTPHDPPSSPSEPAVPRPPSSGPAEKEQPAEEDDQTKTPDYRVEVSIEEQRVRVYRAGELVREMVASTGTPDQPTPTGQFRIQNRGEWFYSNKYRQGARWWVSFKGWGKYLFHSVPMDAQQRIIPEEAAKLGQPASHGCVRLSLEDARWFYETIPAGTPVHIY